MKARAIITVICMNISHVSFFAAEQSVIVPDWRRTTFVFQHRSIKFHIEKSRANTNTYLITRTLALPWRIIETMFGPLSPDRVPLSLWMAQRCSIVSESTSPTRVERWKFPDCVTSVTPTLVHCRQQISLARSSSGLAGPGLGPTGPGALAPSGNTDSTSC